MEIPVSGIVTVAVGVGRKCPDSVPSFVHYRALWTMLYRMKKNTDHRGDTGILSYPRKVGTRKRCHQKYSGAAVELAIIHPIQEI